MLEIQGNSRSFIDSLRARIVSNDKVFLRCDILLRGKTDYTLSAIVYAYCATWRLRRIREKRESITWPIINGRSCPSKPIIRRGDSQIREIIAAITNSCYIECPEIAQGCYCFSTSLIQRRAERNTSSFVHVNNIVVGTRG